MQFAGTTIHASPIGDFRFGVSLMKRRNPRIREGMKGLEPSTFCMATRPDRQRVPLRCLSCTVPLQREARRALSADVFDDLDQLVEAVAVVACEVDEFFGSLDDRAAFRCACDRDAAPAAELQ